MANMVDTVFNRNRYFALVIMIISGILGWYSTILMTNNIECKLPIPDNNQIIGVVIGILISIFYWINRCYTIQIR